MAQNFFAREGRLLVHELILFGVLLLLTGLRLLTGQWSLGLPIIWWWLGAVLGFVFVFADRIIYAFWQNPETVLSLKLKDLLSQGQIWRGLATLLEEREDQERLIIRSALFLPIWLIMSFLTVFSVGSELGRGFMLGMGIHLLTDLLKDFWGKGRGINLWFWQIKRQIEPAEITGVVWGFTILAVLLMLGL